MAKKPYSARIGKTLSTINTPTFRTGFSKVDLWVSASNYAMNRLWSGSFDKSLLFGRNYVFYGESGCHERDTGIVMFDGTIRMVQDVEVGDQLMGPDSTPRNVLALCRGRERMYKIVPTRGKPFVVNENHVLSLHDGSNTRNQPIDSNAVLNMTVGDYLQQTKVFQERTKLYRVGVQFDEQFMSELIIPPYQLGIWLGDESAKQADVTTMDEEISDAWISWAESLGSVTEQVGCEGSRAWTTCASLAEGHNKRDDDEIYNPVMKKLNMLNLIGNKHIPHRYLVASERDRLELLAGLIDTDGTLSNGYMGFVQKSKTIADQVAFLAQSLGFMVSIEKKIKHWWHHGVTKHDEYYSMEISGDLDRIPTRLLRKQATPRKQIKNWKLTGFTVEEMPVDDFYGFHLDGDHLYLLDDFTVTHNSGKSLFSAIIAGNAQREHGAFVVWIDVEHANDDEAGEEWLQRAGVDTSEDCFAYTSAATLEDIKTVIAGISVDYQAQLAAGETPPPVVFVVDSWAAALTSSQWDKAGGKEAGKVVGDMGQKAKQTGDVINAVTHLCAGLPIMVIGVQHIMDNQDGYGRKHKTTGGNKMLYYASGCMMLTKRELRLEDVDNKDIKDEYAERDKGMLADVKKAAGGDKRFVGINSTMEIIKSRVSKPFDKVDIQIPYSTGIDPYSGLFSLLMQEGVITKGSPGWFEYTGLDGEVKKFQKTKFPNHAHELMEVASQTDITKAVPEAVISKDTESTEEVSESSEK